MSDHVKTAAPAIDGAITILDILSQSPHPLQLSDISDIAGLPQATAHRIINAMLQHNLAALAPGRRKTYTVGSKIYQLASSILGRQAIVPSFHPIAEILKNEIHRTILLSLPIGNQVVIVAKLDAPATRSFNAYIGRTMPMHLSASGKAILAARSVPEQLAYFRGESLIAGGLADESLALVNDLKRSARLGYAVSVNEIQQDVGCVAALVVNNQGAPVAAISACFTGAMLTQQSARTYSKNIVQAARQLSSLIL
ncbi:IclR family transcriptional regulator [Loktanella salsilacus]|jgi:DNA-binding IclR family transcriptional regulator|uniref:IclR family transcriptional regulator n=1 Tax=Loktanella salsilacus TaxID=195913 RepID=UPI003704ABDB